MPSVKTVLVASHGQLVRRPVLHDRAEDERAEQLAPGPPRLTIVLSAFRRVLFVAAQVVADCKQKLCLLRLETVFFGVACRDDHNGMRISF